ncbi:hypothetical protein BH10ACI2_BH10ACI2_17310 [soil metagenome]
MTTSFNSEMWRRAVLFIVVAVFVAGIFLLPSQRHSNASTGDLRYPFGKSEAFANYDIRLEKTATEKLASLRTSTGKSALDVLNLRQAMSRGELTLKQSVPNLKVEYNDDLHIPEVIAPEIILGKTFLTSPSGKKRSEILRNFLNQNNELLGVGRPELDALTVAADYTNPDGVLSYVELEQQIGGVPVFRGEIKAGFTQSGEMIRVINNLAPGVTEASVSKNFANPTDALRSAAGYINNDLSVANLPINEKLSTDLRYVFGLGDFAPTAEKMYFPTEPGVAVPAWRVLMWEPVDAYYVIVDAQTGTLLWRKNITEDQIQPATYSVYANPNAVINLAHSPFPLSPGPLFPNGSQGAALQRSSITRIGNEPPYTFNQLGWLPDGATKTDGNNVQAGIDRDGTNGIDPNSEAVSLDRNFDFAYAPFDANTSTGDSPVPPVQTYPTSDYQQGVATQLFYACNWYHDETYRLGFTEEARNFQNVNFTGKGEAGDRVSAEGQDSSGTNNANFATAADGVRGRMQMYLFSTPSPNIDGGLDADVVIHEHTHGLSSRLHGNSAGLFNDMSRSMGEGWSDFYGMSLLSQPTDPIDGIYTTGAYVTYRYQGGVNNSYYGIRRFPTAIRSSVGGPNNRPHNPLTFADIDAFQINISDGAFAPRNNGTSDEVHNAGEIWCVMLWEIRARMIARLGWSVGNRRAMQLIMDGMKLAPLSQTFLSERDAIVAAGVASGSEDDVADIWAGFATRGLGASAKITNVGGTSIGGTSTTRVIEAYDLPNLSQTAPVTIDDSIGDNDGYPEPGEAVMITIPITNTTGRAATDVAVQIVSGPSASYGTITGIATKGVAFRYQIPDATCGTKPTITMNVTSSFGPFNITRTILVGRPAATIAGENFDSVTAPKFPNDWIAEPTSGGANANTFITTTNSSDTAPNTAYARNASTVGGGSDLTSLPVSVTSQAATVTFRHLYNTEAGWDGGVLEISIAGGAYQDIIAAGGSFVQNGYNNSLGAGTNNPVANRAAWTGNSGGYVTSVVQLPASAVGKVAVLKWRFGSDDNTTGTGANPGWYVDSISLSGAGFVTSFSCFLDIAPISITGRVTGPDGTPLKGATVLVYGSQGTFSGFVQRVLTNSFGIYRVEGFPPRETAIVNVSSKRYRFVGKSFVATADQDNVNFTGVE